MFDNDVFLEEMDKLITLSSRTRVFMNVSCRHWKPSIDIYETAEDFVAVIELAGVSIDDVSVAVSDGQLLIQGQRKINRAEDCIRPLRMEMDSGRFSRTLRISESIDEDKINARMKDGLLTITLPKK